MAASTSVLRNRPLLTLMSGHFTVEMYVGLLPGPFPLLRDSCTAAPKTVGPVSSVATSRTTNSTRSER